MSVLSREQAQEIIESLYGLELEDVEVLLAVIGFDALSDQAMQMLAERQQARELRHCRREATKYSSQ